MKFIPSPKTFGVAVLICAIFFLALVYFSPETAHYVIWPPAPAIVSKDVPPPSNCSYVINHPTYRPPVTSYSASNLPEVNGHILTEKEVLCLPSAKDLDDISSAETSVLSIVGGSNKFTLGSEIRVRVDIHDRKGRQKTRGGDAVRMWLRDKGNKASAAGYVVDLRNGSYEGVLRAVWSGKAEVVAAIATPLEQIQMMYRLYGSRGTIREISGKFVGRDNKSHITWCFPEVPATAGKSPETEVCNLTSWNFGEGWYCYRPIGVNCSDYLGMHYQEGYGPLPKTQFESSLIAFFHKNLRHTLTINVSSDTGESVVRATTPCHQRPWAATFLDTTPVGFFFQGTWHLRHCDIKTRTPLQAYRPCLQNKTLYFFGDSTMRFLSEYLTKELKFVAGNMKPHRPVITGPTVLAKPDWNFTLYYTVQGMPFYGQLSEPIGYNLDGIPSNANGIVFMTLYQHFSGFHPDAFRGRVRSLAEAVGRLVQRAPKVQVAVRGCHAYYHNYWDHVIAHDDYWGKLYDQVWKEELFPWSDHVVFLDTWDMTMAGENFDCHPPGPFLDALMQSLLAYTCKV